jgi:hypothetical protein
MYRTNNNDYENFDSDSDFENSDFSSFSYFNDVMQAFGRTKQRGEPANGTNGEEQFKAILDDAFDVISKKQAMLNLARIKKLRAILEDIEVEIRQNMKGIATN